MDSNLIPMKKEYESSSVNSSDERSQVVTERTHRGLRLPAGTTAIVAILAITAIAVVLYLLSISNRSGFLVLNRSGKFGLVFCRLDCDRSGRWFHRQQNS